MPFLGWCNVEIVSSPGFQDLSCSKVTGFEGSFFQKLLQGYIFCFLGYLLRGQLFERFACETKLKKKHSVSMHLKAQLSLQKFSIVLMNLIEMKTPPAIYLHNIRWEQLQIRANMAEMGQLKSPRLKTWEILPFKKRKKTCFFTEHHWRVASVPQLLILSTLKSLVPKEIVPKAISSISSIFQFQKSSSTSLQ